MTEGRKMLPYGCGTEWAPGASRARPALPSSVIAFHWAQPDACKVTFPVVSGWHIFMFNQHGIISPLMSKVRAPRAPRGRPVESGIRISGSVEVLSLIRHIGSGGNANLACDLSRLVVLLSCYTADSFLVSLFLLQRWGTWQTSSWCL